MNGIDPTTSPIEPSGTRTKVVYIAGPFRGPTHWAITQNIRAAEWYALEVWKMGGIALCPHLNTRNFQGELPDEAWLDGDLVMLERCDAVLLVPNWDRSVGAKAESHHAETKGIPIFTTTTMNMLQTFINA